MKSALGQLAGIQQQAPQRTPVTWLPSCTGRANPGTVLTAASSLRAPAQPAPASISSCPSPIYPFGDRPGIVPSYVSAASAPGCHLRSGPLAAATPRGRSTAAAAAAADIATGRVIPNPGNPPASHLFPSEADELLLLQPSDSDSGVAFPAGAAHSRAPQQAGLPPSTSGAQQSKRPMGPSLLQRPAAPAGTPGRKKRATPNLLPFPGGVQSEGPTSQRTVDEQRPQQAHEQEADEAHGSVVTWGPRSRSKIAAATSSRSQNTTSPAPVGSQQNGGRGTEGGSRGYSNAPTVPDAASGEVGSPGTGGVSAASDGEAAARLASLSRRSSGGTAGSSSSPSGPEEGGRPQRRRQPPQQLQALFSDDDPQVAAAFDKLTVSVSGRAPPAPLLSYNDLTRGSREVPKLLLRNAAAGFRLRRPTPIQSHVVPAIMEGRDVLAVSCTGSGKTLAYLLPMLAQLMGHNRVGTKNSASPEALVLVPTRELAEQVYADIRVLLRGSHLKAVAVHGGVSLAEQVLAIRGRFKRSAGGVDLLVATPGRLLQLVEQRRAVRLGRLGLLVVDEADRMMDLGMWPDLRRLLSQPGLPTARQTVLVAAALPRPELAAAAAELLRDQVAVVVGDGSGVSAAVRQTMELVTDETKLERLTQLLAPGAGGGVASLAMGVPGAPAAAAAVAASAAAPASAVPSAPPPVGPSPSPMGQVAAGGPAVVFTRSLRRAEEVAQHLAARGVSVALLHRDLTQDQRDEAMQCFRFGVTSVLVATALASRGLNFPDVAHVINYDVPATSDVYMHQVGRTGRGGRPGLATTLVTSSNRPSAPWLQVSLRRAGCPVPSWLDKMAAEARAKLRAIRKPADAASDTDAAAAPVAPRRRTPIALDDPAAASAIRFGGYVGARPSQQQVWPRGGSDAAAGSEEARRRASAAAAAVEGSPLPPLQPVVRDRRHDVDYWQAVFDSALQPLNNRPVAAAAAATGRSRRRQPAAEDNGGARLDSNEAAAAGTKARRGKDAELVHATHGSEDADVTAAAAAAAAGQRRNASAASGARGSRGRRLLFRDGAVELDAQPGAGLTAGPVVGLGS